MFVCHLDTFTTRVFFLFVSSFYYIFHQTCTQQIEAELKETNLNLLSTRQQIGDLTRQVTILTSGKKPEMNVNLSLVILFPLYRVIVCKLFFFLTFSLLLEISVLRQKLTEKDDETSQLERKVTELSATTSSTMASYTFLEQALIAETTKYDPLARRTCGQAKHDFPM